MLQIPANYPLIAGLKLMAFIEYFNRHQVIFITFYPVIMNLKAIMFKPEFKKCTLECSSFLQ